MAYIHSRNELESSAAWCGRLREDEAQARTGAFADVAAELESAQSAYGEGQRALGKSGYPYNRDMGEFLGLPVGNNGEPRHGYYMASCLMHASRAGEARRAVASLIASGKPLKLVAARDKQTRKPIRFFTFTRSQIVVESNGVTCCDAKRRVRLSSNNSEESFLVAVRKAMETGNAYGA
jgi:hypothetical protein